MAVSIKRTTRRTTRYPLGNNLVPDHSNPEVLWKVPNVIRAVFSRKTNAETWLPCLHHIMRLAGVFRQHTETGKLLNLALQTGPSRRNKLVHVSFIPLSSYLALTLD